MKFAYTAGGSTPVFKKFKIGTPTFATAGIPAVVAASGGAGLAHSTSAAITDGVGVTLDTGTYSTTQGDAEGLVTVVINPDAVWKLRMSGSIVDGAALGLTTNSVAETAGTVVTITTGDPVPNSPDMAQGTVACISGANVGQTRKHTTSAATTATVLVPFLNDIASGDTFLLVPYSPMDATCDNIELTGNLAAAHSVPAVGAGAAMEIHELEFDFYGTPRTNSFVYASFNDHLLNAGS